MLGIDDQRQIKVVGRLGHHVNQPVLEYVESSRKPAQDRTDGAADQADRNATGVDFYRAEVLQIGDESFQRALITGLGTARIQTDSHRGFGGGNQID